jgi:taurine dioxygenase
MQSIQLAIENLTPTIGARVSGVDLSKPIGNKIIDQLEQILIARKVILFEDQTLSVTEQREFATRFGSLYKHPVYLGTKQEPDIAILHTSPEKPTDNDNWHTDVTFREVPVKYTMLYAKKLPPEGGDTLWSDTEAAYKALSKPFQQMLRGLTAVHDFMRSFPPDLAQSQAAGRKKYRKAQEENPPVTHPVVRTHPETGRDCLFVNDGFTTRIKELSREESDYLLLFLRQHIQRPEFVMRWKWKLHALAIWDNRSTQHYAVNDYAAPRIMHRATVGGDRPFIGKASRRKR